MLYGVDGITFETEAHVSIFDAGVHQLQPILWEFHKDDPFAVHMSAPGPDEPVKWVFSRSILADAFDADPEGDNDPLTGEGDVQAAADSTDLVLYLSSPEGAAALIFDRVSLEAFVKASYRIIPKQRESEELGKGIDSFLSGLLGTPPVPETTYMEVTFGENTYRIPESTPAGIAEWEAELLHTPENDDTDTEGN